MRHRNEVSEHAGESYFASISDLMVGILFVFLLMLTIFALNYRDAEQDQLIERRNTNSFGCNWSSNNAKRNAKRQKPSGKRQKPSGKRQKPSAKRRKPNGSDEKPKSNRKKIGNCAYCYGTRLIGWNMISSNGSRLGRIC